MKLSNFDNANFLLKHRKRLIFDLDEMKALLDPQKSLNYFPDASSVTYQVTVDYINVSVIVPAEIIKYLIEIKSFELADVEDQLAKLGVDLEK